MQPPPSRPNPDDPLYETFYGLTEQPFSLTTDPRFLYLSYSHRQALDELLTGLRRREGLLVLTGEPGSGKTTLSRAVIDALGKRTFTALINNPFMADIEVLRTIVRDFDIVSRDDIRKGAFAQADVPQLLDLLETFLASLLAINSYAVVMIDEAHSLQPRVLDQIRVLGSMERDGKRLLQIVLVGTPQLANTLAKPDMTAIADRVSRRASLVPIPAAEVGAYIAHRLKVAGGSHTVQFAPDALTAIYELSRGLPRRINLLCDRSLEFGRQAGVTLIPRAVVEDAAEAILGEHDRREAEHAELAKLTEARPAAARRHEPTQDLDFSFDTPPRPAPEPSTLDNDLSGFQFGARGKTLSLDDAPGPALILETPPPKSKWRYLWIAIGLVVAVAAVAAAFRWFERS